VETDDERGIAHFVEHLAFRATSASAVPDTEAAAATDAFAVVRWLETAGVRFGACQNAYTGMERTVYSLCVPTDDPAFLRQWSVLVCLSHPAAAAAAAAAAHTRWGGGMAGQPEGAACVGLCHPRVRCGRRGRAVHRAGGVAAGPDRRRPLQQRLPAVQEPSYPSPS
jgi:hypothetical protein